MKILNNLDNLDRILDGDTYKKVSSSEKSTWNNKQDKLTNQTAYSAKGSATKVPQITTNTLGQVTGITEVTITQPDISGKENTSNKSSSYTTSSTTTYPNTKALVDGLATKQATLVSGTNIKTVNGNSLLGSGNIAISGGGSADNVTTRLNTDNETEVIGIYTTQNSSRKIWEGTKAQYDALTTKDADTYYYITDGAISYNDLTDRPTIPSKTSDLTNDSNFITSSYHDSTKQDTLTSGTNIKTINNTSLLGSGNISVQPTLTSGTNIKTINSTSLLGSGNISVQPTLTSGTNIKTVNGTSLLGSGNVGVGVTQVTAGTGLSGGTITSTGTISLNAASNTTLGGLKVRLDGTTLYIRNDGQNA